MYSPQSGKALVKSRGIKNMLPCLLFENAHVLSSDISMFINPSNVNVDLFSSGDSVKLATNEQVQTQVAKTTVTMSTDEVEAVVCNVDDLKSGE